MNETKRCWGCGTDDGAGTCACCEVTRLRARLAAAERERDEARAEVEAVTALAQRHALHAQEWLSRAGDAERERDLLGRHASAWQASADRNLGHAEAMALALEACNALGPDDGTIDRLVDLAVALAAYRAEHPKEGA